MSGLAGVLAGRRAPGVYRWDAHARTTDVAHAVEHAGWGFVYLDTVRADDADGFLREVRAAYGLVGDTGRTLRSLAAALSGVHHEHGTVTLWEGWSPFARTRPEQFAAVLDVLGERCDSDAGGAFVVLLRGDGPALGVPHLDAHGESSLR